MVGIAVVIVLSIVFSGSATKQREATAANLPPLNVNAPTKKEIDMYSQQLAQAELQARQAKAQAERSKELFDRVTEERRAPAGRHSGPGHDWAGWKSVVSSSGPKSGTGRSQNTKPGGSGKREIGGSVSIRVARGSIVAANTWYRADGCSRASNRTGSIPRAEGSWCNLGPLQPWRPRRRSCPSRRAFHSMCYSKAPFWKPF